MNEGERVLAAIAEGDARVFAGWLAEAEPRLRRALRPFAAVVDVEAVVQESLLRAWQLAPRVEARPGQTDPLLRFTMRVAKNLALDEARRARLAPRPAGDELPDLDDGFVPPDPWLRAVIEHCRRALPARPRRALEARLEGEGLRRDEELAERIGMRVNTFLQNLSRARRLLSACLERAQREVSA
mgnify:CR=1 FL=1